MDIVKKVILWIAKHPIKSFIYTGMTILSVYFLISIPVLINNLFVMGSKMLESNELKDKVILTVFNEKDILSYVGSLLSFIGTISLGALALWQNKKLNDKNDKLQEMNINEFEPIVFVNSFLGYKDKTGAPTFLVEANHNSIMNCLNKTDLTPYDSLVIPLCCIEVGKSYNFYNYSLQLRYHGKAVTTKIDIEKITFSNNQSTFREIIPEYKTINRYLCSIDEEKNILNLWISLLYKIGEKESEETLLEYQKCNILKLNLKIYTKNKKEYYEEIVIHKIYDPKYSVLKIEYIDNTKFELNECLNYANYTLE